LENTVSWRPLATLAPYSGDSSQASTTKSRNAARNQTMLQKSPLTKKLSTFVALSGADLNILERFHRRRRTFQAGHEMSTEGETDQAAFILADGWAFSYKMLADGSRQIIDFQIPGDFLGLRSILFRTADHSVAAITQIEASVVLAPDLFEGFAESARLATAVLWAASRDEAMVVEHLVNLGRRSAKKRVSHLLLELGARLNLVGLGDRTGYDCPLTQYHLADALGLTPIHLNRILRTLREEKMLRMKKGRVIIEDFDRLKAVAGFDTEYLDHDGPLLR
jgi:CRP-like cAMP-binding protein